MIQTLQGLIETIGMTPAHVGAALIGLLVSWGLTQAIKAVVVLHGRPAKLTAFAIGWLSTYTIAPGWGALPFWLGVAVGLLAPTVYRAVVIVGRARKWEWVAALSGDP